MKLKICIYILLSLVVFSNLGMSQSENSKFIKFKLYKSAEFALGQTQATRTITLGTFSPAIAWGEGSHFHEIQLLSLNFRSRAKTLSYSAGAEYTFNQKISDGETRLRFYLGGGIGTGFSTNHSSIVSPISGSRVNTTGKEIFFNVVVIPRITYEFRKNVLLDVSIPYHLFDFVNTVSNTIDPSLPTQQQSLGTNYNRFFPRVVSLKVGGIILF